MAALEAHLSGGDLLTQPCDTCLSIYFANREAGIRETRTRRTPPTEPAPHIETQEA